MHSKYSSRICPDYSQPDAPGRTNRVKRRWWYCFTCRRQQQRDSSYHCADEMEHSLTHTRGAICMEHQWTHYAPPHILICSLPVTERKLVRGNCTGRDWIFGWCRLINYSLISSELALHGKNRRDHWIIQLTLYGSFHYKQITTRPSRTQIIRERTKLVYVCSKTGNACSLRIWLISGWKPLFCFELSEWNSFSLKCLALLC
jgi:hypothetical protein